MKRSSPQKDFRWVHRMGGRKRAAEYLASLEFGTDDVEEMRRRIAYWTNQAGRMSSKAQAALLNDRGFRSGDFDILTADEFVARQDEVAA